MQKRRLTITLDQRVYAGLHMLVGQRRISQFIESLVRPYVIGRELEVAYQKMAQEEAREAEAPRVGRGHRWRRVQAISLEAQAWRGRWQARA